MLTPVSKTPLLQAAQEDSSVSTPDKVEDQPVAEGDFESYLKSVLKPDSANQVSEEELFAGIMGQRVKELKGDAAAGQYDQAFQMGMQKVVHDDGFSSHEEAAQIAMQELVAQGVVTKEEADKIAGEAFQAAQLDDNTEALFDNRGDTVALATMEAALFRAREALDKVTKGETTAALRPIDYVPWGHAGHGGAADFGKTGSDDLGSTLAGSANGGPADSGSATAKGGRIDGSEGFLWKPVSDTTGKLVVLLPSKWTGDIDEVVLKNEAGKIIDRGKFTSVANGEREHYRFDKPGKRYPENVTVEVTFNNGKTQQYTIPKPGKRYD